mmetsp:Transcript_43844/g.64393  ORF Transcript_43844/g.64393 Transcript_43844/m.64393 type:complete len:93 (-) Transcript_43844:203-481(-)
MYDKAKLIWNNTKRLPAIYNNFEITRVSFSRQKHVREFHRRITEQEPFGVFTTRWGDGLVRYFTVSIFMEPEEVDFERMWDQYEHPCDFSVY